jgi:phenylalanyl-tRNA synthetase alpha chain
VEVLNATAYADLPRGAQARLRLRPDQANALVRLTLRPLSKTLADGEANDIRDDIYRALHEGPVLELIG